MKTGKIISDILDFRYVTLPKMIFLIFTGVGTRCVDGLGEAGRVGCLDVAAAALPGEM